MKLPKGVGQITATAGLSVPIFTSRDDSNLTCLNYVLCMDIVYDASM